MQALIPIKYARSTEKSALAASTGFLPTQSARSLVNWDLSDDLRFDFSDFHQPGLIDGRARDAGARM